jgi:hypothetical protein
MRKDKLEAGANHRVYAARLLESGHAPGQVAAVAGAARHPVYRWGTVRDSVGRMRLAKRARADSLPDSVKEGIIGFLMTRDTSPLRRQVASISS